MNRRNGFSDLDVSLRVTWFYYGSLRQLEFLCWLRGFGRHAQLLVVQANDGVGPSFERSDLSNARAAPSFVAEERTISEGALGTLLDAVRESEVLDRELRIEPMIALEEVWEAQAALSIRSGGRRRDMELSLIDLGIQGPDADLLRSLFAVVLEVSGTQNKWVCHLLTGTST